MYEKIVMYENHDRVPVIEQIATVQYGTRTRTSSTQLYPLVRVPYQEATVPTSTVGECPPSTYLLLH